MNWISFFVSAEVNMDTTKTEVVMELVQNNGDRVGMRLHVHSVLVFNYTAR